MTNQAVIMTIVCLLVFAGILGNAGISIFRANDMPDKVLGFILSGTSLGFLALAGHTIWRFFS